MLNPRLAKRYAKSIIDLSLEKNQLEETYKDMVFLQAILKSSKELNTLLKSQVVTPDKKQAVLDALTKDRVSVLTASFNRLLIRKGREANLPEIAQAFIDQYKDHKKIQVVKLITASPISDAVRDSLVDKIKAETNIQNIELTTEVNPDIIGGFVLQMGDTLIDSSISYDLNAIKKQFMNNDFIYKIR